MSSAATDIVSAADVGEWLNLSSSMVSAKTAMLEDLIASTVELIEGYTWLSLLRRTYVAEYNLPRSDYLALSYHHRYVVLTRAPILTLDDITQIEYLDDTGSYQVFDRGTEAATGLFDNVTERLARREWATLYFKEDLPFDPLINAYKLRVTFDAGFSTVPASLKTAIKMIVASDYTNRGDCGCEIDGCGVPCQAKAHLDRWSLRSTVFAGGLGCG